MGLHEVLGCRETDVQTGVKGRTAIRWSNGDTLPGRWFEETLEPFGPNAKPVAAFEDGRVAAVESKFGAGKTLTVGTFLASAYASTSDPALERWFAGLLGWAGIQRPVEVTGSDVEVRWTVSGNDRLVFVFNHAKAPATSTIRFGGRAERATDLVSGREVPLLDVKLEPGQVAVFQVAPSGK